MSGKLAGFLRNNLIALIALFIALGGTSYAAIKLPASSVGTKQLKSHAVTAAKLKAGAVGTAAIANDSVTGDKVLESSLGKVPSATHADTAANATHADTAANATHATSADSATNADTAANATKWGGVSGGALGTAAILTGLSFKPYSAGTSWSSAGVAITSPTAAAYFVAPVSLPQGAHVTAMTQRSVLTAPGLQGQLDLVRIPVDATNGVTVLTIASASVPAGTDSRTVTPASPEVIDNTSYSYALQWTCPGSSNAHLVCVKLEYTLP